ncbi:MAG: TM2 domain-containing protein [Cyanobacteria bacterium SIG26]|nr:TM2 domain-containing protein [Cyanobacteria bacterium SIG26]
MDSLDNLKGKNWVATMALCWALGVFGAHRFYTGKSGTAWAIAILTITGVFSPIALIWTVVDGIRIAVGQFQHADGSDLYERLPVLGYMYIAVVVLGLLTTLLYSAAVFALIGTFIGASMAG